jgi:heptaprenylglyceryl phosphate synthase
LKQGVDVIVVDTAHGHSAGVIERVRWVKQNYPQVQVIGGNIATGDAALALLDAGADAVKSGLDQVQSVPHVLLRVLVCRRFQRLIMSLQH